MSSNFAVWYCVFSQLFTNNHRLKKLDPTSLERNLKILSIIMLLLSPFLAVFQLTLFTFQNFRSDKTKLSLDAVHLTTYSSIFLREYNELTHEFKKRTGDLEEFKEVGTGGKGEREGKLVLSFILTHRRCAPCFAPRHRTVL